jgi:hypothetical protein
MIASGQPMTPPPKEFFPLFFVEVCNFSFARSFVARACSDIISVNVIHPQVWRLLWKNGRLVSNGCRRPLLS